MKNYYEILEIDNNADAKQIKSAYFRLVRKYTPDRFPEEFKLLRAAYETLTDEKKRAEYDRSSNLPEQAVLLLDHAKRKLREGMPNDAAQILQMAIREYPQFNILKEELARVYNIDGKTGKASEVWETLCNAEPENAQYRIALANSYSNRGWRKKAISQFALATKIDPGNEWAWAGLIECHLEGDEFSNVKQLCSQAIAALKERDFQSVSLPTYAFMCYSADGDWDKAQEYLKAIVSAMRNNKEAIPVDFEQAAETILYMITMAGRHEYLPYVQEIADMLPDSILLNELLGGSKMVASVEMLVSEGFPPLFYDLFVTIMEDCNCEDCRIDIASMECNILMDLKGYRPQLVRLKAEHPELYALHAEFFDKTLSSIFPERELIRRLRMLSKKGLEPAIIPASGIIDDSDWSTPETFRRDGPKIGRNDPCPCGSGKKYKKCCGV